MKHYFNQFSVKICNPILYYDHLNKSFINPFEIE